MSDKPIVNPGSMLNTSEGLISTSALAALVGLMNTSSDWRVQSAAALGAAMIGCVYVYCRTKAKAGGAS